MPGLQDAIWAAFKTKKLRSKQKKKLRRLVEDAALTKNPEEELEELQLTPMTSPE